MKIIICGIPHKVVECEDKLDMDIHLGQIDYRTATITLNKDMVQCVRDSTLTHEVMHGILTYIGRDDLSQDEQFVTALGTAVYQTFQLRGDQILWEESTS